MCVVTVGSDLQFHRFAVACSNCIVGDEELSLGKRCVFVGIKHRAVHTLGQFLLGNCVAHALVLRAELLEESHCTAVKYHQAQFAILGKVVGCCNYYVFTLFGNAQHHTLPAHLWQVELVLLALAILVGHCHLGTVLGICLWSNLK